MTDKSGILLNRAWQGFSGSAKLRTVTVPISIKEKKTHPSP